MIKYCAMMNGFCLGIDLSSADATPIILILKNAFTFLLIHVLSNEVTWRNYDATMHYVTSSASPPGSPQ